MRLLYNLAVYLYTLSIRFSALLGNKKANYWVKGRIHWEAELKRKLQGAPTKRVWFHCASLGEFEQGRPILEKLKHKDPSVFIILTFFSPSGYEIRKNYSTADIVCYLPIDKKKNAKYFLDIVSPAYAVFIKYEFWFHFVNEAHKRKIPLYIASAIFRPSQIFFKWYGGFFKSILKKVDFFFLQDENSGKLLAQNKITNFIITGDTRFDRVFEIMNEGKKIEILNTYFGDKMVLLGGSTWPDDENILIKSLVEFGKNKINLIIAPHEVNERRVQGLLLLLSTYYSPVEITKFSEAGKNPQAKVIVIDNIGLLSAAYRYATIAWIGGGFGKGIHNILEAAAFGKPTIFGPHYQKFKEAVELVQLGGSFSVKDAEEAKNIISTLITNKKHLEASSETCSEYVKTHIGATDKIFSHIEKIKLEKIFLQ